MHPTADRFDEQCIRRRVTAPHLPIWDGSLKMHSLVADRPVQAFDDELPRLDDWLRNSYWLRPRARSNDSSLGRVMLHRSF